MRTKTRSGGDPTATNSIHHHKDFAVTRTAAPRPSWVGRLLGWLPRGSTLPNEVWVRRHRAILIVLWLHVPALFVFGVARHETLLHSLGEAAVVTVFSAAATVLRPHRLLSTVLAALGLFTCSAVLVHLSGGFIEMHFHYFVMVGVITLYQDWRPFLIAIGYVVFQHGLAGALAPASVYNHQAAIDHPWQWAGVHGLFVLAMSAAGVASWKLNESLLQAAADREDKLAEAQEVAMLGSWERDVSTGAVSWSDEMFRLLGTTPEALTPSCEAFFSYVHPQDKGELAVDVDRAVEEGAAYARDFRVLLADGTLRWFHGRGEVITWQAGQTVLTGTLQDVTERKLLEDQLAHQAFHDALTNLANQALFRNRVEHASARVARRKSALAVLFLDLDNFKTVNDSLGHTVGDELLVAVARRLQRHVRDADTAARLGGDEFAVLLEDLETEGDATSLAERLILALSEPFVSGGREVVVGVSIGIAFHDPALSCDQLLRNADLAMYRAKASGKGRSQVFEPDMHIAALERLDMEADLRRALGRGELSVHYQPIVAVGTGVISSVEALVRWHHPTRGLLSPVTFIPLAEETGLIHELGRQVLFEACLQARRWQLAHPSVPALAVSVNLSPRQLTHADVVDQVADALDASGLPAASLMLEITEGAMMADTEAAITKLTALKAMGVRLAIDDFGTGYSSLSHLQRFPVDILKIDRSFVAAMEADDQKASLPRAIISLAQTMQLQVVAEGVETAVQLEILSRLGCDFAQGYYFARPQDSAAMGALLHAGLPSASVLPVG
jgi:diguanylate cyclase (GGDEF)-like protein/PAS domain S-box-containing protein